MASELSSLEKGLVVIRALASSDGGMSVAALASASGLNRTTLYRMLDILKRDHWINALVENGEGARYDIGPSMQGLAILVTNKYDTHLKLDPLIEALSQSVSETVHVGSLDHAEVVHIGRALPSTGLNMAARIGSREPAYLAGLGKALLATLPEGEVRDRFPQSRFVTPTPRTLETTDALLVDLAATRARGYSLDDEESAIGVKCVAAPVFGPDSSAMFAISVTSMPQRLEGARLEQVVDAVRDAANLATIAFGGRTPSEWGTGG